MKLIMKLGFWFGHTATLRGMWGVSSHTRDGPHVPCSGNAESWPLDRQRRPYIYIYVILGMMGGEGNGTPLQYSCLENPMDGGAW